MDSSSSVCPYRLAHILDNPIRRLVHNPKRVLGALVENGQTALDLGCGPGTFSIALAEMVGDTGKVIAVDVQEEMLQIVRNKAAQRGLESRIITHKSDPNRIGVTDDVDFALAFYMVHEVPDAKAFLGEIASILKPEGKLLIVEPKFHVSASAFERTVQLAKQSGLKPIGEPRILFSRSMLFQLE